VRAPTGVSSSDARISDPNFCQQKAQAILLLGPLGPAADTEWPALDDLEAWRSSVKRQDKAVQQMMLATATTAARDGTPRSSAPAEIEDIEIQEVPIHVITPKRVQADDRRVYLDILGGAWIRAREVNDGVATPGW
jgi:hypothetical protein